jgi:hypothetical protein
MAAGLSALRTGRALLPPKNFFWFWLKLSELQGIMRLEGLDKFKIFIHLIGTRTRHPLANTIVP